MDDIGSINDLLSNNNVKTNLIQNDEKMFDEHSFEVLRKQIEKVKEEEDVELKSDLLKQMLMVSEFWFWDEVCVI